MQLLDLIRVGAPILEGMYIVRIDRLDLRDDTPLDRFVLTLLRALLVTILLVVVVDLCRKLLKLLPQILAKLLSHRPLVTPAVV